MSVPWAGAGHYFAPKSQLDDGFVDTLIMNGDCSRLQLAKMLIIQDDGDYFNAEGVFDQSMGLEYIKSRNFNLKPDVKGPREGRDPNAIYSIDGEEYPAQDVKGNVLEKVLPIYF